MNTPNYDTKEFLTQFCMASGVPLFDPVDRACVIIRSPAYYGQYGHMQSTMIEWEGSPPRFCLYWGCSVLIVDGKHIHWQRAEKVTPILRRFLDAHPANKDETPVWVGIRYRDKP